MERFDLCVSYRRGAAESARLLIGALEAAGLRVYGEDGETITLLGIQRTMQEHVGRAKFLAVCVDGASSESRIAQWLTAAAYEVGRREGDPARRLCLLQNPRVEPVALPTPLASLPRLTLPDSDDPAVLRALVDTLRARSEAAVGALDDVLPLTRPPWFPDGPPSPDRFVGRVAELYAIHEALLRDRHATIVGAARGYEAGGQWGVGRTLLAQEYALRFGPAWPGGVHWLRGVEEWSPDLRLRFRTDQLRATARRMELLGTLTTNAALEGAILDAITARGTPFLWVVDDVALPADPGWLPTHPLVHTLVIARSAPETPTVTLGPLARAEARTLLTRAWRPHTPHDEDSAWRIVDELAGQPLAVDVCGGSLGVLSGPHGAAVLRAALRRNLDDVRSAAFGLFDFLPEAHAMAVAAALTRGLDQLAGETRDLLRLAAVLPLAPLPPSLLESVFSAVDNLDPEAAHRRTERALQGLDQTGVGQRLAESALDAERYVHPMWWRLAALRDGDTHRQHALREALVKVLADRLRETPEGGAPLSLLAAARLLCVEVTTPAEAALLHGLGVALQMGGDLEEAETTLRLAHEARVRLIGADQRDTWATLEALAGTLWTRGARPEALRIAEDVLLQRRDHLGDGEASTLATMDLTARWYLELGRKAEARTLIERIHEGRRRALGPYHPATLDTSARMARILASDGDFPGAIRLADDVLTRLARSADKGSVDALESIVAVGAALRAANESVAARRILEQASSLIRRLIGTDDARSIHAMTWLAKVLVDLDDLGVARRVETDAYAALGRLYGDAHPETLTAMNNLGTTLTALGEFGAARQLLDRCWRQRVTVLGPRHTDTVVTGWNLHSVLQRLGQDSAAVLAELEWLLDAPPESLAPKQRQVREAMEALVAPPPPSAEAEASPGWQKMLLWATKPFRKK